MLGGCAPSAPSSRIVDIERVDDKLALVSIDTPNGSLLLACSPVLMWVSVASPNQAEHVSDIRCRPIATATDLVAGAERVTGPECVTVEYGATKGSPECISSTSVDQTSSADSSPRRRLTIEQLAAQEGLQASDSSARGGTPAPEVASAQTEAREPPPTKRITDEEFDRLWNETDPLQKQYGAAVTYREVFLRAGGDPSSMTARLLGVVDTLGPLACVAAAMALLLVAGRWLVKRARQRGA
jgi:hypothetical protein